MFHHNSIHILQQQPFSWLSFKSSSAIQLSQYPDFSRDDEVLSCSTEHHVNGESTILRWYAGQCYMDSAKKFIWKTYSLRTFFTAFAGNISIGYFLGRKESGSFWLTAASSMKKEMNFEVKACNPNPLIQRHLHTLGERGLEYGWDCIMYSHSSSTLTHSHIRTYASC